MRVIKRYRNRRLYDTEDSRTIKQADLAGLISDGVDLKIVDTASGEDITLTVLGRVLMTQAPSWGNAGQSKELFRKIITLGEERSMSILRNTVLASIGALQVTKAKAEKVIDDLIKKGELDKSDRKKAVMELLDKAEKSTAGLREKVAKEAGKAQHEISKILKKLDPTKLATKDDLKKLEGKVDKLSKAIKALEKKL